MASPQVQTAKYSEIQPNSIQPAIQPCRVCRGSGAWPGCAQAAVHAAMGAGYRPTPSVTPSSPTGTLSACVSVRHLVLYSLNTAGTPYSLPYSCIAPYMYHASSRLPPGAIQPYSAIQRCMSIQQYSTIQHTAHTYNTPQTCTRAYRGLVSGAVTVALGVCPPRSKARARAPASSA